MKKLRFLLLVFIPFLAGCSVHSIPAQSNILNREKIKDLQEKDYPDILPDKKDNMLMTGYIKG